MLSGEAWGYDISIFSDYPNEKEILLEPERKLSITGVSRNENIIIINANIVDTPLVLKDIIEVGKIIKIKERKSKQKEIPKNLRIDNVTENTVKLALDPMDKAVSYKISSRKKSGGLFNRNQTVMLKTKEIRCVVMDLEQGAEHEFRMRCIFDDGVGKWSEMIVVKVIPFSESSWKECSKYVDKNRKYAVDDVNPRIATFVGNYCCTIIGNTPLPSNKVTSWNIKVLKSNKNDSNRIYVGVASFDINQNDYNYNKCG